MKLAKALSLAGLLLLGMSVSASGQIIKFGTLAPDGSPWHVIARDMADAWNDASGGEIEVRIYPGGIAGDDPDMVRKIRIGQLQMAGLTGIGLMSILPEIGALQMPLLLADDEELNYVRERISPYLETMLEARGFKLLAWADVGWVHFFTQQPVTHPDDLKRLRLWISTGDTAYMEAWKDAGYNPVPLPVTEIYTGLQSGLIETVTTTPLAALSFQYFSMAGHMTDLKYAPFVGALVISTQTWNQISDDIKPQLLDAGRELGRRVQGLVGTADSDAILAMEKRGLVVHRVPHEAADEWVRQTRSAYPKLVGPARVPTEMFLKVEQLRDEYRRLQEQQ
jgi:TRAP-type C4-dicarboxylate transport system substrate-binding protein